MTKHNIKTSNTRQKRRKYSAAQKQQLLAEALQPGSSISEVSRKHGVAASALFRWRQLVEQGSLTGLQADDEVVAARELKQLRVHVRELERALGKMTLENQILKDAVEITREKKQTSLLGLPRSRPIR